MNEMFIRAAIENFSKLSNEELMEKLLVEMAKEKGKDGGSSMLKTIERIKPLLNTEQKSRLNDVMKSVGVGT